MQALYFSVAPCFLQNVKAANLQPGDLTLGRTVIPTLARKWDTNEEFRAVRSELFAAGLYPGVDYIIEGRNGDLVTLRPAYPLVKKLERDDWPVQVAFDLAPRWTTPAIYNAFTALFAIGLASTWLALGFALSTVLTLSKIPSASMAPAIAPGDVLLVEKLSPRLGVHPRRGDLVFFEPPPTLQAIVAERTTGAAREQQRQLEAQQQRQQQEQGREQGQMVTQQPLAPQSISPFPPSQQLFVKRVAGLPGDAVRVYSSGNTYVNKVGIEGRGVSRSSLDPDAPPALLQSLLQPGETTVPSRSYFVLGDNSQVSIDSRCWGALPEGNVVGRPLMRIFPLSKFGPVDAVE